MALAERRRGRGRTVFAFLGDGTLGEGVVYESLNMASLWRLPLLLVLENNRYAQSTPIALHLAGDMEARFRAFGILVRSCDTTDVVAIKEAAEEVAAAVRENQEPKALILHTYRFAPHSKGDDTRDPAEIATYRQRDPLPLHGARLSEEERHRIGHEVAAEVAEAFARAETDLPADPSDASLVEESKI
jgi:TPP-dependent pyruvate/acetoin dehydrogenase alpha subunit